MILHKHTSTKKPLTAFKIKAPPAKNPVEQLLTLQEAIREVEILIQSFNIILLKVRAIIFAIVPQVSHNFYAFAYGISLYILLKISLCIEG